MPFVCEWQTIRFWTAVSHSTVQYCHLRCYFMPFVCEWQTIRSWTAVSHSTVQYCHLRCYFMPFVCEWQTIRSWTAVSHTRHTMATIVFSAATAERWVTVHGVYRVYSWCLQLMFTADVYGWCLRLMFTADVYSWCLQLMFTADVTNRMMELECQWRKYTVDAMDTIAGLRCISS